MLKIYYKYLNNTLPLYFTTFDIQPQSSSNDPHAWQANGIRTHRTRIKLTHWGRVTYMCASKLTISASDNGLSPGRRQAIISTNAVIMLIGPLGTNLCEILNEIYIFSLKNAFENVVWEIATILSRSQYVTREMPKEISTHYNKFNPNLYPVARRVNTHSILGFSPAVKSHLMQMELDVLFKIVMRRDSTYYIHF